MPGEASALTDLTESAGAAIANAVYNATGERVHDHPSTLDKIIAGFLA